MTEKTQYDPYEILGVKKNASVDEIKNAFRKTLSQHYPDRGGDEVKYKAAIEAYEDIMNERRRVQENSCVAPGHHVSTAYKKSTPHPDAMVAENDKEIMEEELSCDARPTVFYTSFLSSIMSGIVNVCRRIKNLIFCNNAANGTPDDDAARRKLVFWKWVGGTYLSLLLISTVLSVIFIGADWNWGLALFLSLVLYTIASARKLGPTEQGVRVFYGRPIDQVSSGFVLVPSGLVELVIFPCSIIQNEFPDNPEKIYRGKDGDHGIIPPGLGLKPPIRIPFGLPGAQGDSVLDRDPLNQRLIEEVVPIVRWKITDCIAFLTTIVSIEDATSQLEDLCVATLSEEFGKLTPAQVVANYQPHNDTLTEELQEAVNTWGMTIESAKVKVINFSHDLNKAIQTIAEKTATGKANTIEAEGLKRSAILKGEGDGAAEKALLVGRTAGLKNMLMELSVSGQEVLAAETARGITNNPGQKTIIAGSGGFKDLAMVGTILGETLTNRKEVSNVV